MNEELTKLLHLVLDEMKRLPEEGVDFDDSPRQNAAAAFCHELLTGVNRDGWGGCRLCRS